MSKFAILRVGKLKSASAIRGMLKHNFRSIETPNADPERLAENEHLTAQSVADGMKRYRERLPEKVRKNAVHALDYLVTTSPDASSEAKEKALQVAFEWLSEKHGKQNIIMASKHRDETTPHAHFLVMPIDEKGKLNARSFIGGTRHRMSELQDEFFSQIEKNEIDLKRGLKGSKAKHTKIKDFYKALEQGRKLDAPKVSAKSLEQKRTGMLEKESLDDVAKRVNELLSKSFSQKNDEIASLRFAYTAEKEKVANNTLDRKKLKQFESLFKPLTESQSKQVISEIIKYTKTNEQNKQTPKDMER